MSPTFRCAYLLGREQIEIREIRSVPPGPGEIVLSIDAATTCGTDVKVFLVGGHPRMLLPPCPFGHEIAGTIAEVGRGVSEWSAGDRVVVANSASCGECRSCGAARENLCEDLQYLNGGFAERLTVPERFVRRSLHRRPDGVDAVIAALAEPLACVVHGLERMRLDSGADVLLIGGGPIGLMFVYLLARHRHRVTLLDPNPNRLALGTRLGADRAHRVEDRQHPLEGLRSLADSARGFDAAVDATGTPAGWSAAIDAVGPGGTVNFFGGCPAGTSLRIDTERPHYRELSLLGSYHHRPASFREALNLLAETPQPLGDLVSFESPLGDVEAAIRAMIERRALKVAIRPGAA